METIKTRIDGKIMKAMYRNTFILMFLAFLLGGACIAYYFVFSSIRNEWADIMNIILLVLGIIVIAVDVVSLIIVLRFLSQANRKPVDVSATFGEGSLDVEVYQDGKRAGGYSASLPMIKSYRVNGGYVFITFKNRRMLALTKTAGLLRFLEEGNAPRKG